VSGAWIPRPRGLLVLDRSAGPAPQPTPPGPQREVAIAWFTVLMARRRTLSAAVIVAVILAVIAVVSRQWLHNHPPYGPEALAVKSSLSFVSNEEAQAALGKRAYAPVASERDQLVLGRSPGRPHPSPSMAAISQSSSSTSAPATSRRLSPRLRRRRRPSTSGPGASTTRSPSATRGCAARAP